jgi:hypothetical protein
VLPYAVWTRLVGPRKRKPHAAPMPPAPAAAAVTGVVEDVHMAAALTVDGAFAALRRVTAELRARGVLPALRLLLHLLLALAGRALSLAADLFWRALLWLRGRRGTVPPGALSEAAQTRGVQAVIAAAGYPYERHSVTTQDGYVLVADRMPRRGSPHAVLFVHGILDCAFAWVGAGPLHALAYRAHDAGCDVWLLNLRYVAHGCLPIVADSRVYL